MLTRRNAVVAAFIALALGIAALVVAGPKLRSKPSSVAVSKPSSVAVSKPSSVAVSKRGETVRFAIYDAGIYPSEARVAAGRVTLQITDYTHGPGLVVERVLGNGTRSQTGRVSRRGPHWRGREELLLTPGTYRVYDAARPENQATLIVEP